MGAGGIEFEAAGRFAGFKPGKVEPVGVFSRGKGLMVCGVVVGVWGSQVSALKFF